MKPLPWATAFATLGALASLNAQSAAEPTFEALRAEYKVAEKTYRSAMSTLSRSEAYREARQNRDREATEAMRAELGPIPSDQFLGRFQKLAAQSAGEDGAIPALVWIITDSRDVDARTVAIDTLLEHHAESDKLVGFAEIAGRLERSLEPEKYERITKTLLSHPHPMVQAHTLFARASKVVYSRGKVDAEQRAAALKDLDRVQELAAGTALALRAAGPKFAETRLQIGMQAPDITGADLDGIPFKLSDYQGKVVVLDFWGDW